MSPPAPGAPTEEQINQFEQHARALLEDSVAHVDGRIRSRLNLARHAAVEQAARPRSWLRRYSLMPAGAVAAAVLVAFVLWPHTPADTGGEGGARSTVDDIDMLADSDALDLVSDETDGGAFYEWAVDQADNGESAGTGA